MHINYDLDIDPMTSVLDLNLDIMKTHLCTKNEVCMSSRYIQKLEPELDRHTHRRD